MTLRLREDRVLKPFWTKYCADHFTECLVLLTLTDLVAKLQMMFVCVF